MPTLLIRLDAGLDSAPLDAALGGEVGKLLEIGRIAAALRDSPPGLEGVLSALSRISVAMPDGTVPGDVASALAAARAALQDAAGGAAPAALAGLSQFGSLVADRLSPLLGRTVEAARAIEALARVEFRCPPPAAPPGLPTPPPPPPAASGQGRAQAVGQRADELSARLDQLPDPLTPGALIEFLAALAGDAQRARLFPMPLPVLDDVALPLQTLARWATASPDAIGAEVEATLAGLADRFTQAASGRLDLALAPVASLQPALARPQLESFAETYLTAARHLAAALKAGDLATAAARAADIDAALDAFEPLRASQAVDLVVGPPVAALRAAPTAIHDELLHLAVQVEPFDARPLLAGLTLPAPATDAEQQALTEAIAPVVAFLDDIARTLDLAAIQDQVGEVAAEAQAIAEQITAALAAVAQETRAAFAGVDAALQELPLDDLAAAIRDGIAATGQQLQTELRDATQSLTGALGDALQGLADAIDQFDPGALTSALQQVVDSVAAILQDPGIRDAVAQIRTTIDEVAATSAGLSFAPVTDEVIALIEKMTEGLRAVGSTEISDAVKGLLATALAVLPPDLRPATTPLIDELGRRVDAGPVALLERARAVPQQALDRIKTFDPGRVVTQALGAPFDGAVAAVGGLRPSQLMAPLGAAIDREKQRLRASAAPSRALGPLSDGFSALLTDFDAISPDRLLAPIESAIEQAVADVIAASPVDEVLAEISQVFATVEAVLGTVQTLGATLDKTAEALAGLDGHDAAIDAWRDGVLARLDGLPNAPAVAARMAGVATAIDQARGPQLLARLDAALAGLVGDLEAMDADGALAAMVAVRQQLDPLVRAMPQGAERAAVEAALGRFDPLDPVQAGGLRAAAILRRAITETRARLAAQSSAMAPLLFDPDEGALTLLERGAADASLLRGIVAADVDAALALVRLMIGQLSAGARPVAAFAGAFAELHQRLTATMAGILTGPASLQAISQATQSVVDALRHIDLGFLRQALAEVFATVRGQIDAANPGPLLLSLDSEFGDMIDALDPGALLAPADIAALDAAAAGLSDRLRALDPGATVAAAVGPAFEAEVVPLIEALDLAPVFDALIEALRGLEQQLESELGRVNGAYQQLLAARPAGLGVSVSVGVG